MVAGLPGGVKECIQSGRSYSTLEEEWYMYLGNRFCTNPTVRYGVLYDSLGVSLGGRDYITELREGGLEAVVGVLEEILDEKVAHGGF